MKIDFQNLMAQATRLTRGGDLRAATAAIQAALRRGKTATTPAADDRDVIDVIDAVVIDDAAVIEPAATVRNATSRGVDVPPAPASRQPDADTPPDGPGRVIAGRHADAHSGRDFKLYVPPQAGTRPLPVVVMLHGCTQDADDFAAGTAMNDAARAAGCYVLYPEQSAQANPQRCWNWFKHSHQQRGRGEPALLAGMVRQVMAEHAVDPARVYVAGLSAGGAMAAILGAAYPELFAAVGVHSGLAAGAATDLPGALSAMRQGGAIDAAVHGVPTIVFHGDADATVHPVNGEQVLAASAGSTPGARVSPDDAAAGTHGSKRTGRRTDPRTDIRASTRRVHRTADGRVQAEHWLVHGGAHAWAGGSTQGSYTDPRGPDATAEMLRFFLEHPRAVSH